MTPAVVAVIRAAALRANLQKVRNRAPGCRVLAVIKADAYGHGLVDVAHILDEADALAVARMEEAIALRDAGIDRRIVVLGGFVGPDEAVAAMAHRLDLVVHSLGQIDVLERIHDAVPVDCWLKVDTGMGRLGLEPGAVGEARLRLENWTRGRAVLRLMTHFAAADEAGNGATAEQLAVFSTVAGEWPGDVSLANSAAILQWPGSLAVPAGRENWVRPGLMLYGVSPVSDRAASSFGLRVAMSFETRLIAVKKLVRGRRVGYGGDWRAARDSVVGVAAAGYADGYPWHISTATPVLVRGRRAPVLGRVSMDMISVDLTDIPDAVPGDRVVLWGDELPVADIARCAGTIPYELLAGLSPRVARRIEE
jgi:alanine racemase